MESIQKCFLIISFLTIASCAVVRIENGEIEGTTMITRKGVPLDAFLKIPFAEAPVPDSPLGNLRFQPPIKRGPWTGILNATAFGPMCMQNWFRIEGTAMHEDCLHLNVFTKNLGNSTLKPVIVFVHGGSFEVGSAINHGPMYLLDRDIVLVTINYRVAAFGFLATGSSKAMGNMGLKDQVMALEWIRDNIGAFGGDPNQVTVSGLSAGGFSVSLLMLSEASRHLFQRVILMSGAISWMTRVNSEYLQVAQDLAAAVNCTTGDIVECLQEVPAETLAAIDMSSNIACRYSMAWLPVVEQDFNQTKFLSRTPLEILKDDPENNFKDIQVMIGITEHEMSYIGPMLLADPYMLSRMSNDLNQLIYDCFYTAEVPKDSSVIKKLYLPFNEIDQRSFDGIGDFVSDGYIGYGSHRFAHLLSNFTDVYYYKFTYAGQMSVFNYPREYPYGITHADDIQYLFNTWYVGSLITESHRDNMMVERLTRIWEQFAYRGNPNNGTDEHLRSMVWPKLDWINEYYMEIGTHMIEKHGLNIPQFTAWDQLNSAASKVHNLILIAFISLTLKLFM